MGLELERGATFRPRPQVNKHSTQNIKKKRSRETLCRGRLPDPSPFENSQDIQKSRGRITLGGELAQEGIENSGGGKEQKSS